MNFRVILSSNFDERYIQFWPFVAKAWKRWFNCHVTLGLLINDKDIVDYEYLRQFGEVKCFREDPTLPSANQAKVIRFLTAMEYPNEVCMMNDIDMLPLTDRYYTNILRQFKEEHLLLVGCDTYNGTPDEGKCPFGYMTATGATYREVINPGALENSDLLNSWIGLRIFDDKEDISLKIHNENPKCFSDESLIRALIKKHNFKRVQYFPRGFVVGVDSIDRGNWKIDYMKLRQNEYIESHMLRPYSKYKRELDILFKHLGVL